MICELDHFASEPLYNNIIIMKLGCLIMETLRGTVIAINLVLYLLQLVKQFPPLVLLTDTLLKISCAMERSLA
jgi:hypothetical protein